MLKNCKPGMIRLLLLLLSPVILLSCSESSKPVPIIEYTVTNIFPHDTTLFTEGLVVHNGELFESTGSPEEAPHTESLIGTIDLTTGKMNIKVKLDRTKYFGEGIAFLKDKLYQLTYKNKIGFIYDAKSFKQLGVFPYPNAEGWGLTTDGTNLIMSDGTYKLSFLDPENLQPQKILNVTENGNLVEKLNELEFINGFIYANVWTTNNIVKIDPLNGNILGKLDLNALNMDAKLKNIGSEAMNGIAWDAAADKIYVTGKFWPNIYQIAFSH
jgi:glutamine cyclotransferase